MDGGWGSREDTGSFGRGSWERTQEYRAALSGRQGGR